MAGGQSQRGQTSALETSLEYANAIEHDWLESINHSHWQQKKPLSEHSLLL